MKVAYIDQYRETFGVQPICDVLAETDAPIAPIAPSTYYAAHSPPLRKPKTLRGGDVAGSGPGTSPTAAPT